MSVFFFFSTKDKFSLKQENNLLNKTLEKAELKQQNELNENAKGKYIEEPTKTSRQDFFSFFIFVKICVP